MPTDGSCERQKFAGILSNYLDIIDRVKRRRGGICSGVWQIPIAKYGPGWLALRPLWLKGAASLNPCLSRMGGDSGASIECSSA